MPNVMYCLHYKFNVPKVLPYYSSDQSIEELDARVPYYRSHSVLYKAFPDDTPESEILGYFKKAHEDRVKDEISKLKARIGNLEKRVQIINNDLSIG